MAETVSIAAAKAAYLRASANADAAKLAYAKQDPDREPWMVELLEAKAKLSALKADQAEGRLPEQLTFAHVLALFTPEQRVALQAARDELVASAEQLIDQAKTIRRPTSPEFESVAQITIDLCRSGKSFIRGTLLGRPNAGGPYVDDASVPKEVLRLLTELREEYAVARPNDELMQKGRK